MKKAIALILLFLVGCKNEKIVLVKNEDVSKKSNTQTDLKQQNLIFGSLAMTCAILESNNELKCWGLTNFQDTTNNSYHFKSDTDPVACNGGATCYTSPVPVLGLPEGVITAGAGAYTSVCVVINKSVYCWGAMVAGELGMNVDASSCSTASGGTAKCIYAPTKVVIPGDPKIVDIKAGFAHYCALTESGDAYCWGYNGYGQLGYNSSDNCSSFDSSYPSCSFSASKVIGISGITKLILGSTTSCFLLQTGAVKCAGLVEAFDPATGSSTVRSVHSTFDSNVIDFFTGAVTFCGQKQDGKVYCFGANQYGELGRGTSGTDDFTLALEVTAVADSDKLLGTSMGGYGASSSICSLKNGSLGIGQINHLFATKPVEDLRS